MATRFAPVVRRLRHSPDNRPFLVIWEITRACDLACRHCRAHAVRERHPDELTTQEGQALIDDIARFGSPPPLLILTGGDPFKRDDLPALISHGRAAGLAVAVAPSATPLVTPDNLARIHAAGATALSLSLDGSTAAIHDAFRGVEGTFDRTLAAWEEARAAGMKVQINTTATPDNLFDLPEIFDLVRRRAAMTWSVFFLVPTGRGRLLPQLSPQEFEDVLHFLWEAGRVISVKTTEAQHFRRVTIQRTILEAEGADPTRELALGATYRALSARLADLTGGSRRRSARRPPLAVGAGDGFAFVSHTGLVSPSGFLPLPAGNVRRRSIVELYRESPLFRRLRDREQLKGRCGICEFAPVCGGSRSRAFGVTGDPLQEEASCAYRPGSFGRTDKLRSIVR